MVIPFGAIRKKRIINAFLAAGAGSRSTAKTCEEAGVFRGLGIKFQQLIRQGILVPCGDGAFYVDESIVSSGADCAP